MTAEVLHGHVLDVMAGPWCVARGAAADVLCALDAGSAQLVLSDPPYNIGMPFPGYEDRQPWEVYWAMADATLAQCARILRPGGVLALLLPFTAAITADGAAGRDGWARTRRRVPGVEPVPLLWLWLERARAAGLLYEDTVAISNGWVEEGDGYSMSTAIGSPRRPRLRSVCRGLMVCWQGTEGISGRDAKLSRKVGFTIDDCKNHWRCAPAWGRGLGHPTPMPRKAVVRAIRLWSNPGDLVVDPFCGSGTVIAEAVQEGRRAFGIDIAAESVAITGRRMAQVAMADAGHVAWQAAQQPEPEPAAGQAEMVLLAEGER